MGYCILKFTLGSYMEMPALKALFQIVAHGCPDLKNPDSSSSEIKQFIHQTTQMEPSERPSSQDLLQVRISLFKLTRLAPLYIARRGQFYSAPSCRESEGRMPETS